MASTEAPVAPIARKGTPLPSTVEDKLVHAQSLKELANDNFRQGNIKKAKNIYHKIFAFTAGLQEGSSSGVPMLDGFGYGMSEEQQKGTSATKEQVARAEELCVLANSNLAACALRLEQPQRAITYCREALKLRQESPKALFRLAQAQIRLGFLDEAKLSLADALRLAPDDKAVKLEQRKLAQAFKAHRERERACFSKAFAPQPAVPAVPEEAAGEASGTTADETDTSGGAGPAAATTAGS